MQDKPEKGKVVETKTITKTEPQKLELSNPSQEIKAGTKAATALMQVVDQNKWAVNIQGKKYLVFEAWQTLGRFYGLTVKTGKSKFVEYGTSKGFEAEAEILNKAGDVVGGAEAVCLDDEPNWKGKPLYSLKSMAQTRAGAKALRQVLSWVAVLAGFQPTPKEEVPDEGFKQNFRNKPATNQQATTQTTGKAPKASQAQLKLIDKLASEGKIKPSIDIANLDVAQASGVISQAMKVSTNEQ